MSDLSKQKLSLSLVATIVGIAVGFGIQWSAASSRVSATEARLSLVEATAADHETRIRPIEANIIGISADVKWIRRELEGRQTR